jgi:hypothetical protein
LSGDRSRGRKDIQRSRSADHSYKIRFGYINNQERRHAKMNFAEELTKMLERHGIKPFHCSRD